MSAELTFGWCLDGHHEQCQVKSADGKLVCACTVCGDKHGTDRPQLQGVTPEFEKVLEKYRK